MRKKKVSDGVISTSCQLKQGTERQEKRKWDEAGPAMDYVPTVFELQRVRHVSCRAGPGLLLGTIRGTSTVLPQDVTGVTPGSDALRKEPCLCPKG